MNEQVKKSPKRSTLIISLIAGVLVLAAVLGTVLYFVLGPNGDEVEIADGGYLLYWNLDRDNYAGQAADGKTSREPDDNGFYNIRLAYRGKPVTRKTQDRELANEIDSYDVFGLTFKDGIITDVISIDELTGGFACEGKRTYVTAIDGQTVTVKPDKKGDAQYELTLDKKANIFDVSGETEPVGGITKLRADDKILAVQNGQGVITDVFVVSRADLGNVRYAYCEHCKQEVKWIGWEKITVLPAADSGHYFLMNDILAKAQTSLQADVEIILDLNGKTIQGKEDNRVFSLHNQGCYLAIMDTSAEQTGKVVAGDSMLLIHQGACVWVRYGVFELYGGTLDASKAYSVNNGAAVCVPKDSTFNMYGGTITGGTISTKFDPTTQRVSMGMGGNVYVAGTFNMYDGLITKGKAEAYYFRDNGTYSNGLGGNVFVAANGVFNMEGGELRDGTSHGGGGNVFVNAYGTVNMSGDAKITGGKTIRPGKNGGSVYIAYNGVLNMDGGTIDGGATTNRGGNMVLYGVLNMTDGVIQNGYKLDADMNPTLADFGNIFVVNGEVNMSGGYIKGHVYLMETTSSYNVNLSGTAKIKDAEDGYANLYIRGGHPIHVKDLKEGAEIYVTASGTFTSKTDEANKKYFHLDYPDVGVVYYENCLFAGRMGCICGTQDGKHFGECDGTQLAWGAWSNKSLLPTTTGNYYLLYDVGLNGQVSVTNEANIVLDLNGKTVQGKKDGRIYSLHATEVPVSITVTDSSKDQSGKMITASVETKNEGLLFWLRSSKKPHTLTIYAGTFDASGVVNEKNGAAIHGTADSTINIYGGTIIGGTAKSVWNAEKAEFSGGRGGTIYTTGNLNMTGGVIKGGKAVYTTQDVQVTNEDGTVSVVTKTGDAYGGNVVLAGDFAKGSFTGGTIEGGSAVLGGNFYIGNKSTAEFAGVTLKNGVATKNGGNVYMGQMTRITMNGGQILGGENTEEGANGGSIYISGPSVFVMKDGLVSGGKSMNMGGNFDVRGTLQVEGGQIKDGISNKDKTDSLHSNMAIVNLGTSSNNGKLIMTGGEIGGGIYSQTDLGKIFTCITVSRNAKITAPEGYLGVTLRGDAYLTVGGKDVDGNALGGLTEGAEIWVNQTVGKQVAATGTEAALSEVDLKLFKHETGYYTLREDGKIYLERTVEVTTAQELHDALQAGYSVILKNDIDYDASKIVDADATDEAPGIINVRNRITLDMQGHKITYTPAADPNPDDEIPPANKFMNLMGTAEMTVTGDGTITHRLTSSQGDNAAMFRVAAGKLIIENGTFERVLDGGNGMNRHVIWNSGSGVVEIKGGTFRNWVVREIYDGNNATITGGMFYNNPADYGVVQGYGVSQKTVDGVKWWVVEPAVEVGTAQELHDALQAGKSVILKGDILYNAADIQKDSLDSNSEAASIINVSGYVYLDTNGHTITYNPAPNNAANKFFNMTAYSRMTIIGKGSIIHNVPYATTDNGATFRVAAGELIVTDGVTVKRVFTEGNTVETGRYIFWDGGNSKLLIKDGTFISNQARCVCGEGYNTVITGGTFNSTPAGYGLRKGYDLKITEENGMTLYTVLAPVEVKTAQELHDALQSGRSVILKGNIAYVASEVTDAAATAEAAGIVNISAKIAMDLNGYTITYTPDGNADKFFNIAEDAQFRIFGNGGITHMITDAAKENGATFRVAAGTLIVEGGKFERVFAEGVTTETTARDLVWDSDNGAVYITGGEFTNESGACVTGNCTVAGVSGGSFNVNPEKSIAFGYKSTKNDDGIYLVGALGEYEPVPVTNAEQLKQMLEAGRTAALANDITYDLGVNITCRLNAALQFNGHTITFTDDSRIDVYSGAMLTVSGNGGIVRDAGHMFRVSDRGQLVINGGTFTGSGNIIHAGGNNADGVTINGGTFNGVVNSYQGTLTISGGTFNAAVAAADATTCNVTGGTFATMITTGGVEIADNHYLAGPDSNGMYQVLEGVEPPVQPTTATQLKLAMEAGKKVVLCQNLTYDLTSNITCRADTSLDLNGYTITWENDTRIDVYSGCTVTINGTGGIVQNNGIIFRVSDRGQLVINGGTFTSSGNIVHAGGTDMDSVTINGGTFNGGIISYQGTVSISGGMFNYDPSTMLTSTFSALPVEVDGVMYYDVHGFVVPGTPDALKTGLEAGRDIKLTGNIVLEGSDVVTLCNTTSMLDLNGCTLTIRFYDTTASQEALFHLIGANFTVWDTSAAKTGKIEILNMSSESKNADLFKLTDNSTLTINGGTFVNEADGQTINGVSGSIALNGGAFNKKPVSATECPITCKSGYVLMVPNGDTMYTLVAKPADAVPVADAAGLKQALERGEKAWLIGNITISNDQQIEVANSAVLDLNGYTITVTNTVDGQPMFQQSGNTTLTVMDGSALKNGKIEAVVATNGVSADLFSVGATDKLIVHGGNFVYKYADGITAAGASADFISVAGIVEIDGGSFENKVGGKVYVIEGSGEFKLAVGYFLRDTDGDGIWTVDVLEGVGVNNAEDLKTNLQNGVSVYLTGDITATWEDSQCIAISGKTVTLDLNGFTLNHAPAFTELNDAGTDVKGPGGTRLFNLLNGTVLTTKDSFGGGVIQTTARMTRVNTGTTWNVESGTYKCLTSGNNIVFWDSGTVAITGGSFTHAPGADRLAAGCGVYQDSATGLYVVISAGEAVEVNNATDLNANLTAGNSVKLGCDIAYDLNEYIMLDSGISVTLDLNGYTITQTGTKDRLFQLVAGKKSSAPSSLTIKDSSNGLGAIESAQKGIFRVNINSSYGDAVLNIEGGRFVCSGQMGVLWGDATSITGGVFSGVSATAFPTATYIASGYEVVGPVNGYFAVVKTVDASTVEVHSAWELKIALESGKNVKLGADVNADWEDSQCITISGKTVTLDLNGHVLNHAPAFTELNAAGTAVKGPTGTRLVNLLNGTVLTTKDSVGGGVIQTTARMMRVNTGTTWNVQSGTYKCLTSGNNIVFWDSGTVAITGGSFTHAPGASRLADASAYQVTGPVNGLYTVTAKN